LGRLHHLLRDGPAAVARRPALGLAWRSVLQHRRRPQRAPLAQPGARGVWGARGLPPVRDGRQPVPLLLHARRRRALPASGRRTRGRRGPGPTLVPWHPGAAGRRGLARLAPCPSHPISYAGTDRPWAPPAAPIGDPSCASACPCCSPCSASPRPPSPPTAPG